MNKDSRIAMAVIAVLAMFCLIIVLANTDLHRRPAKIGASPSPKSSQVVVTVVPESDDRGGESPVPVKTIPITALFAPTYAGNDLPDLQPPATSDQDLTDERAEASDEAGDAAQALGDDIEVVEVETSSVQKETTGDSEDLQSVDSQDEVAVSSTPAQRPESFDNPQTNSPSASNEQHAVKPEAEASSATSQTSPEKQEEDWGGWRPVKNPLRSDLANVRVSKPKTSEAESTNVENDPLRDPPQNPVHQPNQEVPSNQLKQETPAAEHPVTLPASTASLSQQPAIYVVLEGESLLDISHKHFGVTHRWPEIYRLNREVLSHDVYTLLPGTRLKLPKKDEWRATNSQIQPLR